MRLWRAATGLLLVLAMGPVPVLACLQPEASLTAEEQACCRQMREDCGGDMQAMGEMSHSCCHKTASHSPSNALKANAFSFAPAVAIMATAAVPSLLPAEADFTTGGAIRDLGPPGPGVTISILRI